MSMEGNAEYDRGFLEGSKTQNLADHKLIIEPIRAELKEAKDSVDGQRRITLAFAKTLRSWRQGYRNL